MLKEIVVPDIGNYAKVDIIEVLIKAGEKIGVDAALITLETDKASMEIPSPYEGVIKELKVKVGDKVSAGDVICTIEVAGEAGSAESAAQKTAEKSEKAEKTEKSAAGADREAGATRETKESNESKETKEISKTKAAAPEIVEIPVLTASASVHAGPGVRRLARELGVDLSRVQGTGRKDRILQSDVQKYVKNILQKVQSGAGVALGSTGAGVNLSQGILGPLANLPPWPQTDHSQFGEVVREPLSRIKKLSGGFLHRNWVMVPHITQFDEADITELEKFRKESQALAEEGVKLTPIVFIMKAVTAALQAFPSFNSSLDANGTDLILKKYFHIGVAVDTPNGLVVPVVRDVDQKGLFQLAKELGEISKKARNGQLKAQDMQGSSFSISSLGGIGGTAFTPIINVPDVAILGVSKASMKPIYQDGEFVPRLMLPLSLSYDHRVIDGAEAARFIVYLVKQLSDIRRLLL